MLKNKLVKIKLQTLDKYCSLNNKHWNVITNKTYDLSFINKKYIDRLISLNIVLLTQTEKNLAKFERIFKK